jgi:hypothetical protein
MFLLPDGFTTDHGVVARDGKMRLAMAGDEIVAMGDYRAAENKAYSVLILLSRVITGIGPVQRVFPDQLETLSKKDLLFLQDFYEKINNVPIDAMLCTRCGSSLIVDPATGAVSENTNAPNKSGRR